MDGYALGGGSDLLLHSDIVIASKDAKIGHSEVIFELVNFFSRPMLQWMVGC